jgi:tripartite ATP-independent transporter DctM subunit
LIGAPQVDAAAGTEPVAPLHRLENAALVGALLLAMGLPLIDAVGRPLGGFHVPGGAPYLQQLTLWLAFLGGLVATREGQHLTLSTAALLRSATARRLATVFAGAVSAAVAAVLAYGGARLVAADRERGKLLPGGIPEWIFECILPLALALIALRFVWRASPRWRWRAAALGAIGAAFALGLLGERIAPLVWPLALVILAGALLGAPVFVAMGGLALLLFFKDATPVAAVPAEVYRLISSPTLPAIPLLTACGYVLAESGASRRLVRFFRALFGWLPGGMAVMVAAVCALFTTFTGGSGVTIIALGGLVYPMLREDGYSEEFALGLVTAAGSLGLLFPPSLPVVLYSVVAGSREMSVPADALYLAGLLPGLLLVAMVAGYGIWVGYRARIPRQRFVWSELARAAWLAKWELLLPVFVVALFASGLASMVETAAAALAFAIVVECGLLRDLHPWRDLPRALVRSSVLTGAVLILLASALGLTSYLVDAQIPESLIAWVRTHISSPLVFLLALNLILLVLGSVLEIYSAIIILAPLVAPLGLAFGIDPVHLGVIFLANLELGFLFPPVGLNLFLSSSRFGKSLPQLYRYVLPFLFILGLGVLLITYVPALSLR